MADATIKRGYFSGAIALHCCDIGEGSEPVIEEGPYIVIIKKLAFSIDIDTGKKYDWKKRKIKCIVLHIVGSKSVAMFCSFRLFAVWHFMK
jgi:hypothetical protein